MAYKFVTSLGEMVSMVPRLLSSLLGIGDSFSQGGTKRRFVVALTICLPFLLKTGSMLGMKLLYTVPEFYHSLIGFAIVAWMLVMPWHVEEVLFDFKVAINRHFATTSLLGPAAVIFVVAAIGATTVSSLGIQWPMDALYGVRTTMF